MGTHKVLTLILFTLLLAPVLFGQPYRPLLSHFNEWHVTNCNNGCLSDVYYTDKDTVVDNLHYHILDGYHYISRTFLLREDTTERRIYLYKIDTTPGSKGGEEFLLYDFSLNTGDSVEIHNPISPMPADPGYFRLDSIVSQTMIDGLDYNFHYLTALDPAQAGVTNTVWVEGVGSLSLINTPGSPPVIDGLGQLSCFFYELDIHYQNLDSVSACVQVNTDLSTAEKKVESMQVYPNPFSDFIVLKEIPDGCFYHITSMSGKLSSEGTVQNSMITHLNTLDRGVYILKVVAPGGVLAKRIVKE